MRYLLMGLQSNRIHLNDDRGCPKTDLELCNIHILLKSISTMTPLPTLLRYGTGGESWASRYFNRFPMPKAFGNSLSLFLPTFGQTDCNFFFVRVNATLLATNCCIYFLN